MLVRLIGNPPIRARGNDVSQVVYHLYLAAKALDWRVKHIAQWRIQVCRMLKKKHPEFEEKVVEDDDGAFLAALIKTGNAMIETDEAV
jgi:hypothetical protein